MPSQAGLSPNCGPRRDGLTPTLIVLHYTAMQSAEAAVQRLCDPAAEVSAHYLITRTGEVISLVPEPLRAWHAGQGTWQGHGDVNSRSIGIELDNTGATPFAEPLMSALEALIAGIQSRWNIPASNVIGHSDMSPGRKIDPGPRFDWRRLERQGLAKPPRATTASKGFRAAAISAGYPTDANDATLLEAVRLRLRPWANGPLSDKDTAALFDS